MTKTTPKDEDINPSSYNNSQTIDDSHSKLIAARQEVQEDPKPTKYAWFCLGLIMLISIGNQWQRYTLAYAYGYKGDAGSI